MSETPAHNRLANAIRALAMDAVEKAASGHPGMPMGMADVATVLFSEVMNFDASAPDWPDRDRFVLSAGHGSMLIYAVAYLLGYDGMGLDDLKAFRQLDSKTAGHPEYGHAPAVETTTGPLGQGLGNAVGMAMAEAHLSAVYGAELVDHHTYVIAGDGCLMEGVSQEAISLAGHLKLRKLIVLWDDNNISIDGKISLSDSTDQRARFEASGWRTDEVDGHDPAAIKAALIAAKSADRPTLIACKTVIGKGSPNKQGTASTHGSPLGADEVAAVRKALDWPYAPFEIPDDVLTAWRGFGARGGEARAAWEARRAGAAKADEFRTALDGKIPSTLDAAMRDYKAKILSEPKALATRKASELALEVVNAHVPMVIGGSADLTGSNNTKTKELPVFSAENYAGRYVHYGIREHGMAAAMNGMALHKGVIPYGGTFLVFTDYCRPSIRLSALMGVRVIYVMTHDSIGLGEDGPTHQPVEHLAALRAIPNLNVFRPADTVETAECWQAALADAARPSVIVLTRQGLDLVRMSATDENLSALGAYEARGARDAQVSLFATGSEVGLAIDARQILSEEGVSARVVSVPCWEAFEAQPENYRTRILGASPVRIAIEAGVGQGWERFIGADGVFIGMSSFGASAPYKELYAKFGITAEAVAKAAKDKLAALA